VQINDRLDQIIDVPHFSKSHLSVLVQIADWAAHVVNRHLLLTRGEETERYEGERAKFEEWHRHVGDNAVSHAAVEPSSKDALV
jgi:GAF domain-containing protein